MSLETLGDRLFGTEPRQRIRAAQAALALGLVLVCAAAMLYAVMVGIARPLPAALWALASVGGIGGAFIAIRSGWSQRFSDPSLTLPQIAWSIGCVAAGYLVAGRMRGAVFPILFVVMMFGMFKLSQRQVRQLSFAGVLVLAVTMALAAWFDPQTFDPAVEFGHFVMVAAMLPMVAVLAGRLGWLREQRRTLASALERVRDLALIDLDHFKQINDSNGHAMGDEVLRMFAREALTVLRAGDVLGRWGGEEFMLLLPDARLALAVQAVERLRARIAALVIFAGRETLNITLSGGIAEYHAGEAVERTLDRADAALYDAKARGRNRIAAA